MSELMLFNANLGKFELCQRNSNGYIYVHLEERLDEKSLQIPNEHSKNRTSKVRRYSRQTKMDKRTNNGQQITTRKTKIEQHELN